MIRSTNIKLISAGRTLKVFKYKDHPLFYGFVSPKNKGMNFREKTQEEILDNRRRSMNRSRTSVYNIVSSNAWFWNKPSGKPFLPVFLTLTCREDYRNIQETNKLFNKFIKKFNYHVFNSKKNQLKYLAVIEFQDKNRNGVIHYHVIFFNLKFVYKKKIEELWSHGYIKIRKLDRVKNVARYITKYMGKNFQDTRLDKQKRYFCSRNMKRPVSIRNQERATELTQDIPDIYKISEQTFDSKYQGKVICTEYDFGPQKTLFDIINKKV